MRDLTGVEATEAQQSVLSFIIRYQDENGNSPTVREIAAGVGDKSPHAITGKLEGLEKRGLIKRDGTGKSRSIRVVGREPKFGNANQIEGDNSVVSFIRENKFVVYTLFNGTNVLKTGIVSTENLLAMSKLTKYGIDQSLPTLQKAAKLAERFAWDMIPVSERVSL